MEIGDWEDNVLLLDLDKEEATVDDDTEPTFLHQAEEDRGGKQPAKELDSDIGYIEYIASSMDSESNSDSEDSEGSVEELYS